jgi:hypothetical protein
MVGVWRFEKILFFSPQTTVNSPQRKKGGFWILKRYYFRIRIYWIIGFAGLKKERRSDTACQTGMGIW